jgi:hypothetical protein
MPRLALHLTTPEPSPLLRSASGFIFLFLMVASRRQGFFSHLKGTVRPDWICLRVVSLKSPLKGHQPLYVFNFLFLILNF